MLLKVSWREGKIASQSVARTLRNAALEHRQKNNRFMQVVFRKACCGAAVQSPRRSKRELKEKKEEFRE
jgi:hypothetical protein